MTIAISLVVGDGVVLGTDSATSIVLPDERYDNIYLNAEKTINLVKGLPLGLMTYGLGSPGQLSIASLGRILRAQLSGDAAEVLVPPLDRTTYTVRDVGMPIPDAIDLVQYIADVTTGYMRFKPGIPSVAPPIDIATITRFQGFRWVRRKHFFPGALNPVEPSHHVAAGPLPTRG